MNQNIRCIIVDDEKPARDLIRHFLSGKDDFEIIGECDNGFDALKMVRELNPDLLFLDVQMPRITGIELLEVLEPIPEVIFTTAYDQYALKAFEMNAVDYLLKPFSSERFNSSLEKAVSRIKAKAEPEIKIQQLNEKLQESESRIDRIICKKGSKLFVVPTENIFYFEAQDDYVKIHTEAESYLKEQRMKFYEEHLPDDSFVRVHRSFIVNIDHMRSIEKYSKDTHLIIMKNGDKVRVSSEGYKRLRNFL